MNSPEPEGSLGPVLQLSEAASTSITEAGSAAQLSPSQIAGGDPSASQMSELSASQLSSPLLSTSRLSTSQLPPSPMSASQLSASPLSGRSSGHPHQHHHPHAGVKDSMLAYGQAERKEECDSSNSFTGGGDMRLLSRDSAAFAYSAFSLQEIQSPPVGLKATATLSCHSSRTAAPAGGSGGGASGRIIISSVLDSLDQNLLLHLSGLPANQLEDLENVLLPHLTVDPRVASSSSTPPPAAAGVASISDGDLLLEPIAVSGSSRVKAKVGLSLPVLCGRMAVFSSGWYGSSVADPVQNRIRIRLSKLHRRVLFNIYYLFLHRNYFTERIPKGLHY